MYTYIQIISPTYQEQNPIYRDYQYYTITLRYMQNLQYDIIWINQYRLFLFFSEWLLYIYKTKYNDSIFYSCFIWVISFRNTLESSSLFFSVEKLTYFFFFNTIILSLVIVVSYLPYEQDEITSFIIFRYLRQYA